MDSRIEKYYKQDLSEYKRTKKNAKLYQEVYGTGEDLENLPLSDNARELNLSQIKQEVASREEYQRAKEYSNITNSRVIGKKTIDEENISNKKSYDINELLEKAKTENKKVLQEEQGIDNRYLKSLEKFTSPDKDIIKEKQDEPTKEDSFEKKVEEKMYKTASLSLDILSDLKPDDNTMVSAPIKEEVKEEILDQKGKEDAVFYSGTYSFKKEDFDQKDDDFSDIQATNNALKIILLLFGILVCVVAVVLALKYLKII